MIVLCHRSTHSPSILHHTGLKKQGEFLCCDLLDHACHAAIAGKWQSASRLAKDTEEISWEGLHSGSAWRNVAEAIRGAYAQSQFILAAHETKIKENFEEAMRHLDMAIMMGSPQYHDVANKLIAIVQV